MAETLGVQARASPSARFQAWSRATLERVRTVGQRVPRLRQQARPDSLVSVSIDAAGISLAAVQRAPAATPRLTRCEFLPLSRQADPALALRGLLAQAGLEHASCRLVLNPEEYQLLLVEPPDVPDSELREAVRWRIRDLIDFPVEEATVDVFDMPQQSASSRDGGRMMCVVVARTPLIADKAALVNRGGAELEVIDVPDLALRNLLALTPADATGAALLYVGAGSSMILVTAGKTLYLSRRVWIGQAELTAAPGDEFQRTAHGLAMELLRSLEYYETHFSRPPVESLYLAPLGATAPALQGYLAEAINLRVQPLDLNRLLDVPRGLSAEMQVRALLSIGAALRQERATL